MITAEIIDENGTETSQLTIMRIYEEQLMEMKKLKGKNFAYKTLIINMLNSFAALAVKIEFINEF
jgi:hypothetical protein